MRHAHTSTATPTPGTPGTAAANRIRPTSMTYPDGKQVQYAYAGANGVNDNISRIAQLQEATSGGGGGWQTVAGYDYLGQSQPVRADDEHTGLMLDPWGGGSGGAGSYDGLDRFNRQTAWLWQDTHPSLEVDIASLVYGYDRDSLPTYREDLQAQANSKKYDELYGRDGLNRLDDYKRGELVITAGVPSMPTTPEFQQDWALDQVANWAEFKEDDDGSGTWNLDQDRTHNKANEVTVITGGGWNAPSYDDAGNTTQAPSPNTPGTSTADLKLTYDAWNRVVKVTNNGSTPKTLAEYCYDARGFRVQTKEYVSGSHDATRDFYYTNQWQCIEERVTDTATSTTTLDRQYLWGLRYIDDLVRRDRDTTGNGTLDETLYALNDRQFNVIALWDPSAGTDGEIVERMAYTPYGEVQFLNEDFTTKASSSYAWNHLFQGLQRDQATHIYHNRARDLHPLLGRFLQRDPLGYPDGLNAYAAYHVVRALTDSSGLAVNLRPLHGLVINNSSYDVSVRGDYKIARELTWRGRIAQTHYPRYEATFRWMQVQNLTAGVFGNYFRFTDVANIVFTVLSNDDSDDMRDRGATRVVDVDDIIGVPVTVYRTRRCCTSIAVSPRNPYGLRGRRGRLTVTVEDCPVVNDPHNQANQGVYFVDSIR